jgi:hypothetical protein
MNYGLYSRPIYNTDNMDAPSPPRFLRDWTLVVRKPHACENCKKTIGAGETARATTLVDGETHKIETYYAHTYPCYL